MNYGMIVVAVYTVERGDVLSKYTIIKARGRKGRRLRAQELAGSSSKTHK